MLIFNKGFSQDFMDVIVKKSCDCLEHISDTLKTEQFNMELGLCMIDASMPYKKQIKKSFDIDLDNISTEGEKLGRLIGMKMATVCPNALIKMSRKAKGQPESTNTEQTSTGTVTKIENDFFVVISLKDESGKVTRYYWLTFVESQLDLVNSYSTLIGKSLSISYESSEFFDPKLLEYRQFFIIKSIAVVK